MEIQLDPFHPAIIFPVCACIVHKFSILGLRVDEVAVAILLERAGYHQLEKGFRAAMWITIEPQSKVLMNLLRCRGWIDPQLNGMLSSVLCDVVAMGYHSLLAIE